MFFFSTSSLCMLTSLWIWLMDQQQHNEDWPIKQLHHIFLTLPPSGSGCSPQIGQSIFLYGLPSMENHAWSVNVECSENPTARHRTTKIKLFGTESTSARCSLLLKNVLPLRQSLHIKRGSKNFFFQSMPCAREFDITFGLWRCLRVQEQQV